MPCSLTGYKWLAWNLGSAAADEIPGEHHVDTVKALLVATIQALWPESDCRQAGSHFCNVTVTMGYSKDCCGAVPYLARLNTNLDNTTFVLRLNEECVTGAQPGVGDS